MWLPLRWLRGIKCKDPSVLTRWVFLRLLGAIYFLAFASAARQIDGLIGSGGILPVAPFLKAVGAQYGWRGRTLLPTLLWFGSSDETLHRLCAAGMMCGALLAFGILPTGMNVVLWLLYLSLATAGQTFFGFQWDALLLEIGFLAALYSPLELMLWRRPHLAPSWITVLLLRLLLFRLMFGSGLMKLTGGDVNWLHFSAMKYHYLTQPLPPWTAWYFNRLPGWFGVLSVAFTFLAELVAPFMIFGPPVARRIAFGTLVLLQLLIIVTGNYGFFNLLTIVLCFSLLDDGDWPTRWQNVFAAKKAMPRFRWPRRVLTGLAAILIVIGGMRFVDNLRPVDWPVPLAFISDSIRPFQSINGYGLFSMMTTTRVEIDVQGSDDGVRWKSYEFKWKPGDINRRPAFCVPDMPRLDWQMWFAALGAVQDDPWFLNFMQRLLEGSPAVTGLLEHNPFPDSPPRFVRAMRDEYRFTTSVERQETGAWWERSNAGVYCPPISLENLRQ